MAIQAVLIGGIEVGAGVVSARAYDASWEQAVAFTAVNGVISIILRCLVASYAQNTRQLALADIVIQTTAGFAGVLATRLFCERVIHWKAAVVSSVFSDTAAGYVCAILTKPIALEKLQEML